MPKSMVELYTIPFRCDDDVPAYGIMQHLEVETLFVK